MTCRHSVTTTLINPDRGGQIARTIKYQYYKTSLANFLLKNTAWSNRRIDRV